MINNARGTFPASLSANLPSIHRFKSGLHELLILNIKLTQSFCLIPLILVSLMMLPSTVFGQTNRYVAPDGQGTDSGNCTSEANPCASIQFAINASAEDDIIWLREGIYTGAITLAKNLTIKGVDTGDWSFRPVIQAHEEYGKATSATITISGGSAHLIMDHVLIRHGSGSTGGGISVGGRLTMTNSAVIYNTGSGIFNTNASHLYLDNVRITNNEATFGGGIRSGGGSHTVMEIKNSIIEQNTTTGHGGGIYSGSGLVTIENSVIKNNTAVRDGGGIYYSDGIHNMVVKDSEISHNVAGGNGGGIRVNNGTLDLANSVIKSNIAKVEVNTSTPFNGGGGLYLRGPATRYTITNSRILDNETTESGGGIYIIQPSSTGFSPAEIRNTEISGNKADENGGGVAVAEKASLLIGEGSVLASNTAGNTGGGIWSAYLLEIQDVRISGNTATHGGAIRLMNNSSSVINRARITGNTADGWAGIFSTFSTLYLSNSLFSGNHTMVSGGGAALMNQEGKVWITNTTIAANLGNIAPVINLGEAGETTLTNVLIWGNRGDNSSEQIRHLGGGKMTIASSLIEGLNNPDFVNVFEGSELAEAGSNLSGDPAFAAPLAASQAPTTAGVYRVMPEGAAVNTGSNEAVETLQDLLGNARITGGRVDIGAYEYLDDESYTEFGQPENNTTYNFRDWIIGLRFTGININTPVYLFVEEHGEEPDDPEFDDPAPVAISPKRWVITTTGGDFIQAAVTFNDATSLITDTDPSRLTIYRRGTKGVGVFEPLHTRYFGLNNQITADVTSFSEFVVGASAETVSIGESPGSQLPGEPFLDQNYPNPFNPATVIRFGLPEASRVLLAVYTITGQLVTVLSDGHYPAGFHSVKFDAGELASGLYIYRLQAEGYSITRKMMLLR